MAVIIDIDHETGDLTQYTSTVTDSGDLSVTGSAALAGTNYGLSCLIDDTTAIYGVKDITADTSGVVRFRFYIDPNTLTMADNTNHNTAILYGNPSNEPVCLIYFGKNVSGYYLRAAFVDDTAAYWATSDYTITDEPHYLEVNLIRATGDASSDGSLQLWIDGVDKQTVSGKDNYDRFASFRRFIFGPIAGLDATTSGTFYLDELVINNDGSEIGPVGGETKSISDTGTDAEVITSQVQFTLPELGAGLDEINYQSTTITGSSVWGHETGVTEDNIRTFATHWAGTGSINGVGDSEQICLAYGQYMVSEIIYTGVALITLLQNSYASGDTVSLQYRQGATEADCVSAAWNNYSVPFDSFGYVQIKIESTL